MESLVQIINDELSSYSYIQSYSNMCISKTDVDLNSLLEPGNYYCNLTNDQDGPKYHFPEGSSCILQVVRSNLNGSFIRQFFYRCGIINDNDYQWYTRQIAIGSSNTVGQWKKILSDEDKTELINRVDFYNIHYTGSNTLTNLMMELSEPCISMCSTENITDKPSGKYGVIIIFKNSDIRVGAICLATDGTVWVNNYNTQTSALSGWKQL